VSSLDVLRDRVTSICVADPFGFIPATTPFNFDQQPHGTIDKCFRLTSDIGTVIGGTSYSEQRTDPITIWLARKMNADAPTTYRQLVTDASSLRAAVIRDGVTGGGDYDVPDGGSSGQVQHQKNTEYAVLRLTIPLNYETSV
jgi:hypothetical protein